MITLCVLVFSKLEISIHEKQADVLKLSRMTGDIVHLDRFSTLSVRKFAATEEEKWGTQYLSLEQKWDEVIREASRLATDKFQNDCLRRIDLAKNELVKMEKQAFRLVQQKQFAPVYDLLYGEKHEGQRNRYHEGVTCLLKANEQYFEMEFAKHLDREFLIFTLVVLSILVTSTSALLLIRKYSSAQKQAWIDLRSKYAQFRSLLNQAGDSVFVNDSEGRIVFANEFACENLGYTLDEILNLSAHDIEMKYDSEAIKEIIGRAMSGKKPVSVEGLHRRKDGTTFPVEVRLGSTDFGNNKHVLAIARDITELKEAENKLHVTQKQMLISEKLVGIGQLSAGVCHEILNPLNIMSIHTQMLMKQRTGDPALQEFLTKMRQEMQRIVKIVSALMTFARKQDSELKPVRINSELESAMVLLEKDFLLDNIKIDKVFAPELPELQTDIDEIRQVFLNILNNAKYAMKKNGGVLTLCTETVVKRGRNHVRIKISDTGHGIKKENLDKLFDPFFTTKPEGEGTGMGLAVAHTLIEKHHGTIAVESEEGEGATFIIDLPI